MIIAIPFDETNGEVGQHFGKADAFKFYELDDMARIVEAEVFKTPGKGHNAVCSFLMEHNTEIVICRHLGEEALSILVDNGITVYTGADGSADELIIELINAALEEATSSNCGGGCAGGCCGGAGHSDGADCGCGGGCCH